MADALRVGWEKPAEDALGGRRAGTLSGSSPHPGMAHGRVFGGGEVAAVPVPDCSSYEASRRALARMGMDAEETSAIVSAIGNHDEGTGEAVSPLAAALIIADKTDVRRSRVRSETTMSTDIHDRVNYSVKAAKVTVDREARTVTLSLRVDTDISQVMDYFEIFLERMIMCRKAAAHLDTVFCFLINGQRML